MKNYLAKQIDLCEDTEYALLYEILEACIDKGSITHDDYHRLARKMDMKVQELCRQVKEEVKNKNYGK